MKTTRGVEYTGVPDATVPGAISIPGGTKAKGLLVVRHNSAYVGQEPAINLHDGSNITLTVADDPSHAEVDITITANVPTVTFPNNAFDAASYFETFTDTAGLNLRSHTSDSGATYAFYGPALSSNNVIITTAKRLRSGGASAIAGNFANPKFNKASYAIEGDLFIASHTSQEGMGILARFDVATGNGYRVYFDSNTVNTVTIDKLVGWSPTTLATYDASFTVGNTYHWRFEIRDGYKRLYVNGVQVLNSSDNSIILSAPYVGGQIGYEGGTFAGDDTHGNHIDNVAVFYDFDTSVFSNGTLIAARPGINFIAGTDISITVVDDPSLSTADVTIAATNGVVPTGTILPYAAASAPTGYLLCDGSAVSRTTYAALFALIGSTYGGGDGSTTFNVPDLRQRFPLGVAASGTGSTLGGTGGNIDHVHSVDPPNTTSGNASTTDLMPAPAITAVVFTPNHTHDVNIAAFDSGAANPPFLAVQFVIKT